jgi:Mor family transcriptional regulator
MYFWKWFGKKWSGRADLAGECPWMGHLNVRELTKMLKLSKPCIYKLVRDKITAAHRVTFNEL